MSYFFLKDLAATFRMGQLLGEHAISGLIFAATGDLGAGKTSLAQGVAAGLKVEDRQYVNSPTFTLHQRYEGRLRLHHIDLYRLNATEELINLGLKDVVGVDGVSFIEWPSRAPELITGEVIWLKLEQEGGGRKISFAFESESTRRILQAVCEDAQSEFAVL